MNNDVELKEAHARAKERLLHAEADVEAAQRALPHVAKRLKEAAAGAKERHSVAKAVFDKLNPQVEESKRAEASAERAALTAELAGLDRRAAEIRAKLKGTK